MKNFRHYILLALFLAAFIAPSYAQGVAQEHRSAFHQENYKTITLKRDLVVLRYTQYTADRQGNRVSLSNWYAPYNPMLSTEEAARKLNLPPGSGGRYVERVVIPAGTRINVGKVADGHWENKKLVPNGQSTGAVQYYIANEQVNRVTRVGEIYRNTAENRQMLYRTGAHKPDYTAPSGPSNLSPSYKVRENTNTEHIQQVSKQQGDFPGGVVVQPRTVFGLSPRTLRYSSTEGAFIIDEKYKFYPMLADEEIAQLAGLAFLSHDKRLAAVAQDQFNNISPYSTLALALAEADKAMGWVAFGYNMDGYPLPDSLAAPGYVNPMLAEQKQLRRWWANWSEVFRMADNEIRGIEPRLFMEFEEVEFQVNPISMQIEAKNLNIQVNYQSFEYDEKGEKVFSLGAPESRFPKMADAIRNFQTHWEWYELRFPDLMKVRKIAETYALLQWLNEKNVQRSDMDNLFEIYLNPIELPIAYDNFNNIQMSSPYVTGYKKALKVLRWLPNWIIREEKERKLCMLRLCLAMKAQDLKAIKKYRKKMAEYLENTPKNNGKIVDIRLQNISENLPYYTAEGIYAKQAFAYKYQKLFPGLSQKHYRECIQYYQKAAKIEPDNGANYTRLAAIYEETGHPDKAKTYRQKADALEQQ